MPDVNRSRLSRRRLLQAGVGGVAGLALGGTGLSLFGERNWPRVRRVRVLIPGLPADLHGLTICQISDLHRSDTVSEEFLRRGANLANSAGADVIALTGDYVTRNWRNAESCAQAVSVLRAPLGVFAVLGNHDVHTRNPAFVAGCLRDAGVTVLRNGRRRLTSGATDWWMCGLDDADVGHPDLDAAAGGLPSGAFRLLLCHEPDFADRAAGAGIPLQLSGHSHGGQIALPNGTPFHLPRMARKYPRGLRQVADSRTQVYTNIGLGVVGIPIRINCPPEITVLTLQQS